ncbi:MAG: hypothetical protein AAGE96_16195 [Cyanobacteria bacterium P01_G01_bin.19]
MSFLVFIGLGLGAIAWGLRSEEEVTQLSGAFAGALLLIWGLCLTPQMFLIGVEVLAVIAVFRICVRCCECE